jgi:hypothetical protein
MTIEAARFRSWLEPETTADDTECEAALDAAVRGEVVRLTANGELVAYYQMTDGIPQEVPA